MADATLELEVVLQNGQFKSKTKEINAGLKKTGDTADKTSESFTKFGMAMKTAALAAGALFIKVMKDSIQAASDLQEVTSKFRTVFKGNMGVASQAVKDLTQSYAMSKRESREYLSSIQDLLVPMGMLPEKAAKMSSEVVKLSADLGSFNNLPTAQVMADIQSALVGNFETMKKYGVVLNETVLKQAALEQGVWNGKGAIDAATKAQVAYKLVVAGSQAAIGDMERTQDSWANTIKRSKAGMEDFEAAMGGPLMKTLTQFAGQVDLSSDSMLEFAHGIGVMASGAAWAAGKLAEVIKILTPLTKLIEYNVWAIKQIGKFAPGDIGSVGKIGIVSPFKQAKGPKVSGGAVKRKGAATKEPAIDPEIKSFALRMDMLRNYHGVKLTAEEDSLARERALQNESAANYEAYLNTKLGLDSVYWQGVQTVAQTASVFMAQENKKLFRFGQALAISQAWINTFLGMTKAYAQLGPIGGEIGAGVIFTAGVLQTKRIAQQKPPEFATGSVNVPETSPAIVHKGEMIIPKTFADSVRKGEASVSGGAGGMRPINVQIDGETLFTINEGYRDDAAQNQGSPGSFPQESAY